MISQGFKPPQGFGPFGEQRIMTVSPSLPLLYAHRGAPAELPENTLESFELACKLGVDAIESDVHLTKDGYVVISHDATGWRSARISSKISDCTLAEIKRWDVGYSFQNKHGKYPFAGKGYRIPTLEEALLAFPSMPFNIDLKQATPSMVVPTLHLLERLQACSRVNLASFHAPVIQQIRAASYPGSTCLTRNEIALLLFSSDKKRAKLDLRGKRAQIPRRAGPFSLDSEAFLLRCHQLGIHVDYWTINQVADAQELIRRGADGIMTDNPRLLVPMFHKLALASSQPSDTKQSSTL
jgi:glycerophosphoryl diester phosphodiesterase